ncbi:MAG: thiol:disulfide interchange protein DsbA/DsbL [Methylacidiphilales bacterium]|nr:thiol:disulfide interchange protein DsbA/DsbL [Candidatus Methylacidiphilales bacterium]
MKKSILVSFLMFANVLHAGIDPTLYEPTTKVFNPIGDGSSVEVVEFFWYGCPHCFSSEPVIDEIVKQLPKGASFVRVPAAINDRWMVEANLYYSLVNLKLIDTVHSAIFHGIHRSGDLRASLGTNLQGYAKFINAKYKVPIEEFEAMSNSFGVKTSVSRARSLAVHYEIKGVPALFIAGRYKLKNLDTTKISAIAETVRELLLLEIGKNKKSVKK